MIVKAVFAIGILAAFSFQLYNAALIQDNETKSYIYKSAFDPLIGKVKDMMNNVIVKNLQVLKNMTANLKELNNKTIEDGVHRIHNKTDDIIEYMKEKSKEALQAHVDITKCVIGRKEQILTLQIGLAKNLTICVTGIVATALDTTGNYEERVTFILDDVKHTLDVLSDCLRNTPWNCSEFGIELVNFLATIPIDVVHILNEAKDLVVNIPTGVYNCGDNIANSTDTQCASIKNEIGTCVDEKMNETISFF